MPDVRKAAGLGGTMKMAEYIERKVLDKAMTVAAANDKDKNRRTWAKAICALHDLPAVDVAPVVHGRWAHLGGDEWCCSACGFIITTEGSWDKPTKKYCEDCGAKMDGGADDAKAD